MIKVRKRLSSTIILVVGLIAIGMIMRRSPLFSDNTADVLNSFVLYVSLPAIILVSISKLELSSDILYPVLMHWSLYLINILLVIILSKLFKFSFSVMGCLLVVSCLGNTAFLGIPMVEGFFGENAVAFAVLYDQLGSGLAFIFTMAFILPKFKSEKNAHLKETLINLFKFPPFLALILGFVCIKWPLHTNIEFLATRVSETLVPCAMIAVGYQLNFRMELTKILPVLVGLFSKLLIMPLVALVIYKALGLNILPMKVSVIQSGMPPMVTAGALAMSFNLERDIAAALVGFGLLVSFLTLPVLKLVL